MNMVVIATTLRTSAPTLSSRARWLAPDSRGGVLTLWLEHHETAAEIVERVEDGTPALIRQGNRAHLCGWADRIGMRRILGALARGQGLDVLDLPEGLRIRDTGTERFVFNYASEARRFGEHDLPAAGMLRLPQP